MTSGILQDSLPSAGGPSTSSPRFRPYVSPSHHVIKSRYITSNDPRGYIPVYEYPLNGQWIMMDVDDGYILWTGIWKALGNSKADIVKMIESQPDLASQIRRVRGGYLKIQGTWMPYEVALRLSRRVAWPIRHDLVPLFGPTFPTTCLSPEQPGYGQVIANGGGRRRARRNNHFQSTGPFSTGTPGLQAGWTVISGPSYPHEIAQLPSQFSHKPVSPFIQPGWPSQHQSIPSPTPPLADTLSIDGGVGRLSLTRERSHNFRFSPYPSPSQPNKASVASLNVSSPVGTSTSDASGLGGSRRTPIQEERVKLAPLHPPPSTSASGQGSISLPPISSWVATPQSSDSRAVLQRLQASDGADEANPVLFSEDQLSYQQRASVPSNVQRFDSEPSRLVKANTTRTGAETQHWTSERSRAQDGPPPLQTLSNRRKSDSSSAVSSTSASFLSSTHDGVSPSDPSPVPPLTPHTSAPLPREPPSPRHDLHRSLLKELSGNNRTSIPSHTYTNAPRSAFLCDRDRIQTFGHHRGGDHPSPSSSQLHRTEAPSLSRHGPAELWDKYGTNYSSSYPVRPW